MEGMSEAQLKQATQVLRAGGVIVYPTDTVYGLGVDATNSEAVTKVRHVKERDAEKPILVMVADVPMLERYAQVTPLARKLAEQFLPGPLTLVLDAKGQSLAPVRSSDGSLGFRMPHNEFCLELTKAFGKPITSTSVNHAGMEQPRTLNGMLRQLGDTATDIDHVVDVGELSPSPSSTIVDARGERVLVLREGAILRSALNRFL